MKRNLLLLVLAVPVLLTGCNWAAKNGVQDNIYPVRNPYLSAPVYGVSHFNPAQTDAFPYGVSQGEFRVDLDRMQTIYSGPINIMTLASTEPGYMWGVSTDRVVYIDCTDGKWESMAQAGLPGIEQVSVDGLKKLAGSDYTTLQQAEAVAKEVLGPDPQAVTANGLYTVADRDNNVYVNAGTNICVFGLKNKDNPAAGIDIKRTFETKDLFKPMSLLGMPAAVRLIGMNMTYDGNLIIGAYNGIAVVDREFLHKPVVYQIEEGQLISNSLCVDDKNGIYIVSGSLQNKGDGVLRRVVWTGNEISDKEEDGAWTAAYEGGNWPPAIKAGTGSGTTPTLMGFEKDEDKLVVITDGADRMNLVAFWREDIPRDFKQIPGTKSRRIAGQIPVTAGRPATEPWIQSEQSVAVVGWGAFVVNNVIPNGVPDKVVDAMTIGPVVAPPMGCERFEWDPVDHRWSSVWTRGDAVSISTVPVASSESGIVFINGYSGTDGWEISGLDWLTGQTVTRIIFGKNNKGNGAYAIEQFLPDGDLLLNSLVGTVRVPLEK